MACHIAFSKNTRNAQKILGKKFPCPNSFKISLNQFPKPYQIPKSISKFEKQNFFDFSQPGQPSHLSATR
jgi:hypothetical protein